MRGKSLGPHLDGLVERVVGAAMTVSNTLGAGFLEKVYERALVLELWALGIRAEEQVPYCVVYKGQEVGKFFADVLVEEELVLELKCVDRFGNEHLAQCLNYLKASGLNVCIMLNFQRPRLEWRRVVMNHARELAGDGRG